MTINWSCWTTGNDTTGDGSAGNPYKTITKASTGLSGGDEVRVSKSPAHTALAGTLSFTDGSTSVGTSTDLTAVLAANDLIGKDADDGMWYEITSLNSTTITLRYKYSGTTNAAATAYKMGFHDLGSPAASSTVQQTISASGSSASSLLEISGGWDLSTQTQTGKSFFCTTHATQRYGYGIYAINRNYFSLRKFVHARMDKALYLNNDPTGMELSDFEMYSLNGSSFFALNSPVLSNITRLKGAGCLNNYTTGQTLYGILTTYTDCTIVSCSGLGTTAVETGRRCFYNNLTARNSTTGVKLSYSGFYSSITTDKCGTGVNIDRGEYRIGKATITNCTSGMYLDNIARVFFGSLNLSGNTTDISLYALYMVSSTQPIVSIQRYNDTANDCRIIFYSGVAYRNTAEARSGVCLKATPSSATNMMAITLGKYLVTSVVSDLTLSIYAKDDATFNGDVRLMALMNNTIVSGPTVKAMDTSYGAHTLVVDTDDLVENEWLELVAIVRGTAGNVYFDDFSVS